MGFATVYALLNVIYAHIVQGERLDHLFIDDEHAAHIALNEKHGPSMNG